MKDPREAMEALAASTAPLLIGVRHHSPACALAVPTLLDRAAPERVFVELPADLQSWLEWLGHPDLEAPVALAAMRPEDGALSFYPFASFSPELAAVRWCIARGVSVEAFDRPFAESTDAGDAPGEVDHDDEGSSLVAALLASANARDTEGLWDQIVETPGVGADAEAVRRAALLFGWALRHDASTRRGISPRDLAREAYMRERILAADGRVAAVVGSFHAAALLEPHSPRAAVVTTAKVVTSLIPYSFELLDSRSGYPAGIRDPMWQERTWAAARSGAAREVAAGVIVDIVRAVRHGGHVAGVPDAEEALRLATDLASLRGLAAPGRREVLEAVETAMTHGESLGRGRVVARALERVLVGQRRGRLASGTPRSGLAPHVEDLLAELGLPGPSRESQKPTRVVLDALRVSRDRQRHVALERLGACGVPYATRDDRGAFVDAERLTAAWTVHFTPSTDAMLSLAGVRGVTLKQAAIGALRAHEANLERDDALTPATRIEGARAAAECGLAELVAERLVVLARVLPAEGGLTDLVACLALIQRIERGHIAGLPREPVADLPEFRLPSSVRASELLAASARAAEALGGSTRIEDAMALLELVQLFERGAGDLGDARLEWALGKLAAEGSPLIQGAAGAIRAIAGRESTAALGARIGSWIDAASGPDAARALADHLRGVLVAGTPLFEAVPDLAGEVHARLVALDDDAFLRRLPALREGFDVLSPAARERVLVSLGAIVGDDPRAARPLDVTLEADSAAAARVARADRAGLEAMSRAGLAAPTRTAGPTKDAPAVPASANGAISAVDRWRLVLGRERERMAPGAARLDVALENLYGAGRGEGSRTAGGGGRDASFPTVREWSMELEALFGAEVREEVLGRAVERGSSAAALELEADTVTPSVELLRQVLALKGGLGEAQIAKLRPLVRRIVDALVQELARRVMPALAGLVSPRVSRRPAGPLDLRRTIARNLRTARRREDGVALLPETLAFKTRTKRSLDWHVVLVVDVSGSMEPSVIYSAMMAAILSALPALTVHFVAFNTEIVDLSGRVDDPLALLLEVSVGGGTSIAKGVRYARDLLKVPARSIVVLVSDFEEGFSVPTLVAEVRALVETGAKVLGLAALDAEGKPRYQLAVAELLVSAGMSIAALTPLELARWIAEKIR